MLRLVNSKKPVEIDVGGTAVYINKMTHGETEAFTKKIVSIKGYDNLCQELSKIIDSFGDIEDSKGLSVIEILKQLDSDGIIILLEKVFKLHTLKLSEIKNLSSLPGSHLQETNSDTVRKTATSTTQKPEKDVSAITKK